MKKEHIGPGRMLNVLGMEPLRMIDSPRERYYGGFTAGMKNPGGPIEDPFEVINILKSIEMRNPPFPIKWTMSACGPGVMVRVVAELKDTYTGNHIQQLFSLMLPLPTEKGFVTYWFEKALRAIFMHEFEEAFHIDGERAHDPHENGNTSLHDYNRSGYRIG